MVVGKAHVIAAFDYLEVRVECRVSRAIATESGG
jgi:hypothetical protein